MNDLNILREVGLKEVSRKTHIGSEYLEHIVSKDYEKLLRVNVSGYIKILQREYGLDLSDWMSEYDEYCKAHKVRSETRAKVDPKLKSYTGNTSSHASSGSFGWLLWIVILAIFGVASYFLDAQKYIEQLPSIFEDKNRSVMYSDSSVVQEVQKTMNIVDENVSVVLSNTSDQNLSINIVLEPQTTAKPEANTTTAVMSKQTESKPEKFDENLSSNTSNNGVGVFVAKGKDNVIITPKSNVWIGMINLKTKEKKSVTTAKDYVLDLKGEKLLAFGNGNIVMNVDGEKKSFDPGRAARFLIKDGEIRFLTYEEFVALNGGKSW